MWHEKWDLLKFIQCKYGAKTVQTRGRDGKIKGRDGKYRIYMGL